MQDDLAALDSKVPTRVGEPVHERVLTEALAREAGRLMPPGVGRSLYVLSEPEVGNGRPDAILLTISSSALSAFQRTGLRLPHATAARVLDVDMDDSGLGVSSSYARQVRGQLRTEGWSEAKVKASAHIVRDSLGVEAKMKDWRRAVRQLSRFRSSVNMSALLVPQDIEQAVDHKSLDFYGAGLITLTTNGISWSLPAQRRPLELARRLWLLELLVRGLESGTAHRFSAAANSSIASRNAATRDLY